MTFQKIKEDVVTEKQWCTEKELTKFALNLGLGMITLGFGLSMVTLSMVSGISSQLADTGYQGY